MMTSAYSIQISAGLLLAAALAARGCIPPAGADDPTMTSASRDQLVQSDVLYGTYMGDIGGAPAIAQVSYEPLRDHALFSGEIRKGPYLYTFTSEIVGDGGYGDMLDHASGERFRIAISNLSAGGFMLIANPFEGTGQTAYYFHRSQ